MKPVLFSMIVMICVTGVRADDRVALKTDAPLSLSGRWQVEYGDAMLGVVKGEAVGNRDGSQVRVELRHPDSGDVFTLRSRSVTWDGQGVRIELEGRSPHSQPVPKDDVSQHPRVMAGPDSRQLAVRVGGKSRRIGLEQIASVGADQVVLELKRTEDGVLAGRWVQQADALTERDVMGLGRVGTFKQVRTEHGLAGEQSGQELWTRQETVIHAVIPVTDQMGMDHGEPRYQYAQAERGADGKTRWKAKGGVRVLLVVGEHLPKSWGEKGELVSGDEEHVKYKIHAYPERGVSVHARDFDQGWARLREMLGTTAGVEQVAHRRIISSGVRRELRAADGAARQGAATEEDAATEPPIEAGPETGKTKTRYEQLREMDSLLLWADVAPRTQPGMQSFKLNGALGQWTLKFGDNAGRIGFVRATSESEYELTETLFSPETIRIQVMSRHDLPMDEVPVIFGMNGQVKALGDEPKVMARRWKPAEEAGVTVRGGNAEPEPTIYLSPEIELYDDDRMKPPARAGVVQLKVKIGDKLHVMIGEEGMLDAMPSVAGAEVYRTPGELGSMWKEALKQAADCKGIKVEDWSRVAQKQADEIANYILFDAFKIGEGRVMGMNVTVAGGSVKPQRRTIRVNVGDHAAMILLREQFIRSMEQQVAEYDKIQGPLATMGFAELIRPYSGNERHPFSLIKVTAPNGHDVGVHAVFMKDWVCEYFHLTDERFYQWRSAALREGLDRFRTDMRNTLAKAKETEICDVPGLIELTGWGFGAVASKLTPRLMKLVETEPGKGLHWEPDNVARGYVNGLSTLANAVRDQEDYAELDTAVAITVASLVALPMAAAESAILAAGALAFDAAALGQTIYQEGGQFIQRREATTFARGAAVVIGTDRAQEAAEREKSPLELYVAVVGAGVGTGFSAVDAIPKVRAAIRNMPVEAMRRAGSRVAQGLEEGGLDAFKALPPEDQAAFVAFAADAKHTRQVGGAEAMTRQQKQAMEIADRLQAEAHAQAQAGRATDADTPRTPRAVDDPTDVSVARADGAEADWVGGNPARTGELDRTPPPPHVEAESRGLVGGLDDQSRVDAPQGATASPRVADRPPPPRDAGEVAVAPRDPITAQPPRDPAMSNRPPPRASARDPIEGPATPSRSSPPRVSESAGTPDAAPSRASPSASANRSATPNRAPVRSPVADPYPVPPARNEGGRLVGEASPTPPTIAPRRTVEPAPAPSSPSVNRSRDVEPGRAPAREPVAPAARGREPPSVGPGSASRVGDELPTVLPGRDAGVGQPGAEGVGRTVPPPESGRPSYRVEPGPVQPAAGLPRANEPWIPSPGARPIELGEVIGEGRYATVYKMKGAPGEAERVVKIYRTPAGSTTPASETVREIVKGSQLMGDEIPQLRILRADPDAPNPFVIQEAATSDMKLFSKRPLPEEFGPQMQEAVVELYKKFADRGLIWEDGHFGNIYFFKDKSGKMTAGVLDTDRIARFADRSGKFGEMVQGIEQFPAMNGFLRNDIQSLAGAKIPDEVSDAPLFPDAEFFMEKMLEYGGPGRHWMKYNGEAFEKVLIDPRIAAKHFKGMPDHIRYDFVGKGPAVDRPAFRVEGVEGPDPRVAAEASAEASGAGRLRLDGGSPVVRRGEAELDGAAEALGKQAKAAEQRMARLKKEGGSAEAMGYHRDRLDELEQRSEILKKMQAEARAAPEKSVPLSQADMDWLTGKRRALDPAEMREARKIIGERFGGEWGEVTGELSKGSARDQLLLHKTLTYRKQEVDTLLRQAMNEVEAMTGKKLEKQAFGSTNLTSDYDLSIKGEGAELVVKRFNEKFRAKFGKEPGTFFDTNVYTAPVYDFIKAESTLGRRLSPAQQDVVRQFMYEQVANAKYMEAGQWSRHVEGVLESVPGQMRPTVKRLLDEVQSKQHAAEQAVKRRLADNGVEAAGASDDEILRARNQLYEDSLERIHHLRKLKASLDEMAAGRMPDLEGMEELARGGRGGKAVELSDTKFGRDVMDYYAMKRAGKTGEAEKLLEEMRSSVSSQLRHGQGDALYYASEAYQTQGTIGHVVQDLQASGRGKALTGEALLGRPPMAKDLPLTRGQYGNSFGENNANLYKELNAVKKKLAKAGVSTDGSLSEVFRRIDPGAAEGQGVKLLEGLASKGATKTSKYFVRQLDGAHRAGVDLNEALPERLKYLVHKTVELDKARSSGEAFAATLGREPGVTAQRYTADALEAAEILSKRVNARAAVLDEMPALREHYAELDSMFRELDAQAKGASRYDAAKLREYLGDTQPTSGAFDLATAAGPRGEIALQQPPVVVGDSTVPAAGVDWKAPDGSTLKLGEVLGEGKYSQVYALRDRPDEAAKVMTRGEGDSFTQWTAAETAQRAKVVSDELAEAGIRQLKVNEVRVHGDDAYLIVQKKREGMELFNHEQFTPGMRDQMIAEGKWTKEHEQAVGELMSKLAEKGFVWEDCHIGNMFFERVEGKMTAGVLDHGRLSKWDSRDEIMDNWIVRMQIQPKSNHILSNVGRGYQYQFSGPREFMAKMLEHKGWIRFDSASWKFMPGLIDPQSLNRTEFPLEDWVNPELRKPGAMRDRGEPGLRRAA